MGWLPRRRPRDVILLYHRIAKTARDPWSLCVTPEHFAQHLEVLRTSQRIPLDQIHTRKWRRGKPARRVVITFDDGYADNLHEAAPLLERHETPATFFITTSYVGGTREFWWDELERVVSQSQCPTGVSSDAWYLQLYERLQSLAHEARIVVLDRMLARSGQCTDARPTHRCLTEQELAKLGSNTLFEIGAHTVTHPVLAAQPLGDQYRELQESRAQLETLLGRPVTSLSYPYGGSQHYTVETVRTAQDLGYSRACSVTGNVLRRRENRYELPRLNVTDMDGEAFERLLSPVTT